jgi:DtxR family Mn-dependent transcriptional regulator
MPTPAVEDYLKTIYLLSRDEAAASTSAIAERLRIAAGSVTGMLKRLAERDLVEHVPYYGARLTDRGEFEALRLIRRHRVLELFLVEVLGYTWDRVHDEAELLEHSASDELIDRMERVLGEPSADPHGAPIPRVGRHFVETRYPALASLAVGKRAVVRRVSDTDPEVLRYLATMKVRPGAHVEVREQAPFNGPLRVAVGPSEYSIGRELSKSIQVEELTTQAETDAPAASEGEMNHE